MRIWIFHKLKAGSALMMHHGAVLDMSIVSSFLGNFSLLIKLFLPDITLGLNGMDDYASIYAETCHELAHASHFSKVGTSYWNKYILYVLGSYISTGGMTYGDGKGMNAGYCEIGEMWAYYLSSKMYYERYGGSYPIFGASYWFYPQIFRYVEELGITCHDMFSLLNESIDSLDALKRAMLSSYPDKADAIELVFNRYL
jgi:hypothetical protein